MSDTLQNKTILVQRLTRLSNSAQGNPRWRITDDDGRVYTTAVDSTAGYQIVQHDEGHLARILLDERGLVVGYEREDDD